MGKKDIGLCLKTYSRGAMGGLPALADRVFAGADKLPLAPMPASKTEPRLFVSLFPLFPFRGIRFTQVVFYRKRAGIPSFSELVVECVAATSILQT